MPSGDARSLRIGSFSLSMLAPFLEGTLWRTRGPGDDEPWQVHEIEAEDRKGIRELYWD